MAINKSEALPISVLNTSSVHDRPTFELWVEQCILPTFQSNVGLIGLAYRHSLGYTVGDTISFGVPQEYLKILRQPYRGVNCALLSSWVNRRAAIVFSRNSAPTGVDSELIDAFRHFELYTAVLAAHTDELAGTLAWMTIYRIPENKKDINIRQANTLIPSLHAAVRRICNNAETHKEGIRLTNKPMSELTARQRELAHWVAVGKSNWEVAQILSISEHTVRNSLSLIYTKLGVTNRTQLASRLAADDNSLDRCVYRRPLNS
jgi:DNA-binding CsgD family transcriptional regulator